MSYSNQIPTGSFNNLKNTTLVNKKYKMTNDKALEYQVLRKLINQVSFHTDWPLTIKVTLRTIFTQIKGQNFFLIQHL